MFVVTEGAVTRVLGREIVEDAGDEAWDSTSGSRGCFSSMAIRCGDRSRASSSAPPRLGRRDDTIAALIGREEYAGGSFVSEMHI